MRPIKYPKWANNWGQIKIYLHWIAIVVLWMIWEVVRRKVSDGEQTNVFSANKYRQRRVKSPNNVKFPSFSIIWKRNLLNIRIIADKIRRICILITIKIYYQKHFSWCFIQLNDIKIKCIINKKSVFTTFFLRFLLFWPNKTVGFFGIFSDFCSGCQNLLNSFAKLDDIYHGIRVLLLILFWFRYGVFQSFRFRFFEITKCREACQ